MGAPALHNTYGNGSVAAYVESNVRNQNYSAAQLGEGTLLLVNDLFRPLAVSLPTQSFEGNSSPKTSIASNYGLIEDFLRDLECFYIVRTPQRLAKELTKNPDLYNILLDASYHAQQSMPEAHAFELEVREYEDGIASSIFIIADFKKAPEDIEEQKDKFLFNWYFPKAFKKAPSLNISYQNA